jgi:hypothetical protein
MLMRIGIPAMALAAVAMLCVACVTPKTDTHRLALDQGVAITVPDGFFYKARLPDGNIVGGGPKSVVDTPSLLIEASTPQLTYLFAAQLFERIEGLGEVTLVYAKGSYDLAEIRRSIATDLDGFAESDEKVAAPGSDGNKLVQRLSLTAREIGGYPAVEHEMVSLSSRDLFDTSPDYRRSLYIFRPDGMIWLRIDYSRSMPPDSEGTPTRWTKKDGSPLLTEPEAARKLDALVRSIEVAPPQ